MKKCVFCKIAAHEIPKEFEYEDKDIMVFPDINPAKEVHVLIVAKQHIKDFLKLDDKKLMAKLWEKAQDMVKKHKLTNKGYRLVINGGGAQVIDHLHIHIVGPVGKTYKI